MLLPKLVLLDELMAGLSITELDTVVAAIERLAAEGTLFLVIEHLMDVIKRLSRRLIVIDAGRIVAHGLPSGGDPRSAGRRGLSARSRTSMSLLEVKGVNTGYEGIEVLHGVDLDVDDGETVCVLGANGAGNPPSCAPSCARCRFRSGRVSFQGQDLGRAKRSRPAHIGMGYVPEGRGRRLLTVRENLEMGASRCGPAPPSPPISSVP